MTDRLNLRDEGKRAVNDGPLDALCVKFKHMLQLLEDMTVRADEFQRRVLEDILTRNAQVEYLQRHGLGGATDRETFKKCIPVIQYDDILPDIRRIVNGDSSHILSCEPTYQIVTSSSTSGGESKMFPISEEDMRRRSPMLDMMTAVLTQYVSDIDKGKVMCFLFCSTSFTTPGGFKAAQLSTIFYNHPWFKNKPYDPFNDLTSPLETIVCTDFFQSMYSQMLCGLYHSRQVHRVSATFALGLVRTMKFLENHWKLLADDIRKGTVNSRITDQSVRQSLSKIIKPDPELADFIEFECGKESWQGIIPRLWPRTKHIETIATGSMSQYIKILDFYSNCLPLYSLFYVSGECSYGINLTPSCKPSEVSYTIFPSMAYFEFLPVRKNDESNIESNECNELVDLVDVKLGQEYELVVTTYTGLYRYRVGDVLKVSGFKNKAPQFNFVRRENVALSIDADKTNETELQAAVDNAADHLASVHATINDYTSYPDYSTIPGHYVMFWEIVCKGSSPIPASVVEECCSIVEQSLSRVYRYCRFYGTIGALEVRLVKAGTFNKLMDYAVKMRTSANQYKTPRALTLAAHIELMNEGVISTYFSRSCPKCVAGYSGWNY